MRASDDVYRELRSDGAAEIKVRGSRFIAVASGVHQLHEADAAIAAIRKAEYNATHHCSAYRVGPEAEMTRAQDDGEPNGTAGQPILRQIEGRDLTNTLVVVTRYYGGTKLGTGGLARAYGLAASEALNAATVREIVRRVAVRLRFAYDDTSPALHVVNRFDTTVESTDYADDTRMQIGVRQSQTSDFVKAFVEALAGRGTAEIITE